VAANEKTPGVAEETIESEADRLQRFLERLDHASTHYQVLDVTNTATPADIKKCYYEFARRYHPDRFRKDSDAALSARIEAAFARVTQAYEILREPGSRATYDSKLDAQQRAQAIVDAAPKPTSATPPPTTSGSSSEPQPKKPLNGPLTDAERAEQHFKEGFAAKQMGQVNTAIGLFSAASRLAPNDARYRAYYGHALAALPNTRRLAEAELQAAVKIEPENADYRVMLAELFRDLGFAVRARSEIERILKKSPGHLRARELLRSL
jgi:tetratricopeptide (TPR) repeat protein